jgi:hypothetical protein
MAKKTEKKCITKFCRNKRATGRKLCHKCRTRKYRSANRLMYAYHTKKANAKTKGKPFALTIEHFKQLCDESGYLDGKGRNWFSLSIDCIINHLGYIPGNVRVITLSENSIKGTKQIYHEQGRLLHV